MSDHHDTYEVYALRYGARPGSKASEFYGYHRYGEADAPNPVAYYVFLVRNQERTVLVDCGYNKARAHRNGRYQSNTLNNDIVEMLPRLDVTAADVDHVVLSHMHRDHVGNADRFPNASFSMAREEFEFWASSLVDRRMFRETVEPEEIAVVQCLDKEGRLQLIDGSAELFPGISATRLAGHTPGQLMTEVRTAAGWLVLASDALHFYEELERDRPFWWFVDLRGMYQAFDILRGLESRPDTSVIPGHDPAVMSRYQVVKEDCVDLTAPVPPVQAI